MGKDESAFETEWKFDLAELTINKKTKDAIKRKMFTTKAECFFI